jgi:hypothetical protein
MTENGLAVRDNGALVQSTFGREQVDLIKRTIACFCIVLSKKFRLLRSNLRETLFEDSSGNEVLLLTIHI